MVTVDRDTVLGALSAHSHELRRFGVTSLFLFGSIVRNEAGPKSDVDVLVEFSGSVTYDQYMDLKIFLEDLLGLPVDLVMSTAVEPRMRPYIEQEAVRVT